MKDHSEEKEFTDYSDAGVTRPEKSEAGNIPSDPKITVLPEVVLQFRSGDHRAFEIIFHAFYSKVRLFIRMIVRDDEQAEDLTQQVFVDLWINREKIDPSGNISAYIYTMARNSAITFLKRQLRFETGGFNLNEEEDSTLTDDELIARETALLIDVTVAAMPEKRRLVYEMSRYAHKTNEEIAKELKISRKVVEKHIRLAITELKKVLSLLFLFF